MGTPATSEPAKRRAGRPRASAEPVTAFDAWARRLDYTSARVAELVRDAALVCGVPTTYVPTPKFVDDLRRGRSNPSLVVALLIRQASAGEVDLEHWVRDLLARVRSPHAGDAHRRSET